MILKKLKIKAGSAFAFLFYACFVFYLVIHWDSFSAGLFQVVVILQ